MPEAEAGVAGFSVDTHAKYKKWRIRVFAGTWLIYAGYYLCRKTISIAQPEFMKEFGWGADMIGMILTGYHIGYALGQFVNGPIGDKWGARRILTVGAVMTIVTNLLFGFTVSQSVMGLLWAINGYAQSCGWPSVIRAMSNWFSIKERGKVMGPWGTCYTVGDVVGTGLAAFVIGHTAKHSITNPAGVAVTYADWTWVFWVAAGVLAIVSLISLSLLRDKPKDVGLPEIEVYHQLQDQSAVEAPGSVWENTKDVLTRKPVWILGICYFGIKFIRYTFMFWAVTYLTLERGMATDVAGYISTLFALVGILGTIVASWMSDKVFSSRRAPISAIMLLGLTASLFFFLKAPTSLIPLAIGLVGFMTYGPDFVVSAVAVMDFGSKKGAATAAGFVNGLGSIGQALSGVVVGMVAASLGWQSVFHVLIVMALLCTVLIATMWNKVGTN